MASTLKVDETIAAQTRAKNIAAKKVSHGETLTVAANKAAKAKADEKLVAEFRAKVRAHFSAIAPVIAIADKVKSTGAWKSAKDSDGNPYRSWDTFFALEFGQMPEVPLTMRDDVAAKLGARGMSAANIGKVAGVSKSTAARIVRAAKAKASGAKAPSNNPGRDEKAKADAELKGKGAVDPKADAEPKSLAAGVLAGHLSKCDPSTMSKAEFDVVWAACQKFAAAAVDAGKLAKRVA